MLYVDENVGTLCIAVNRTAGAFGTVGTGFNTTEDTAEGGDIDYSPDSGTVEFEEGDKTQCLNINIENDLTPEVEEVRSQP